MEEVFEFLAKKSEEMKNSQKGLPFYAIVKTQENTALIASMKSTDYPHFAGRLIQDKKMLTAIEYALKLELIEAKSCKDAKK